MVEERNHGGGPEATGKIERLRCCGLRVTAPRLAILARDGAPMGAGSMWGGAAS